MLIKNSNALQEALERQDLAFIDEGLSPIKRTINHTQEYSAPLMISAHKLKHLNKISELQTDAIILNLEDGVSTQMKPYALRFSMYALNALTECDKKIIVRINALDEGGIEEIIALNGYRPDAIRIPKIKTVADVKQALLLCDEEIELHLSIETKEAWLNLTQLRVSKRVKAFYLGVLDLFADMELSQELIKVDNPLMTQLLAQFLLNTKAVGAKAISFVYQEYQDTIGFESWLNLEKELGFDAKGCLSPQQAEQTVKMFQLSDDAIIKAQYIIDRFEEERAKGITGFSDEKYGFIDEPIYKGALALLKR